MNVKLLPGASLALLLAACATLPTPGIPSGPASIPAAPLDLGDWRHMSPESALSAFESAVTRRYSAGLALADVAADLQHNDFNCTAPEQDGRGVPPAQICRRTIVDSGCTHTWQVHLFDAGGDARLDHARELYDRRCGADGLLGGPS